MGMKAIILFTLLAFTSPLFGAEAVIEGPDKVRPGQFVVLDANESVVEDGGTRFWIPDPSLPDDWMSSECNNVLSTAFETAGKTYYFHYVCVDSSGYSVATQKIVVEGKASPPDHPDPPTDPPSSPGKVEAVSRAGAQAVGDSVTQNALYTALSSFTPAASLEETKEKAKSVIDTVLLLRQDAQRRYDWQSKWREPVNEALADQAPTTTTQYVALLEEVKRGLAPTPSPASSSSPKPVIYFYTRDNCPPCRLWKQKELPKLSGYDVRIIKTNLGTTPSFTINGRHYSGYVAAETLMQQ